MGTQADLLEEGELAGLAVVAAGVGLVVGRRCSARTPRLKPEATRSAVAMTHCRKLAGFVVHGGRVDRESVMSSPPARLAKGAMSPDDDRGVGLDALEH